MIISWRKLSKLIVYMGAACSKFCRENFSQVALKLQKFVNIFIFSLESFPLYGTYVHTHVSIHAHKLGRHERSHKSSLKGWQLPFNWPNNQFVNRLIHGELLSRPHAMQTLEVTTDMRTGANLVTG